jgi:hypothetical protein
MVPDSGGIINTKPAYPFKVPGENVLAKPARELNALEGDWFYLRVVPVILANKSNMGI